MVPVPLGIKDAAPAVFSLELVKGTLDVEVTANTKPFYGVLVQAPRKVEAIVKTGRATVSTGSTGTSVAARAGRDLMVAVSERWRALRVGRAFVVTAADPAGAQRPLLPAPVLRIDRPVVLGFAEHTPSQRLSWHEVPSSQGYRVRVHRVIGDGTQQVAEVHGRRSGPGAASGLRFRSSRT